MPSLPETPSPTEAHSPFEDHSRRRASRQSEADSTKPIRLTVLAIDELSPAADFSKCVHRTKSRSSRRCTKNVSDGANAKHHYLQIISRLDNHELPNLVNNFAEHALCKKPHKGNRDLVVKEWMDELNREDTRAVESEADSNENDSVSSSPKQGSIPEKLPPSPKSLPRQSNQFTKRATASKLDPMRPYGKAHGKSPSEILQEANQAICRLLNHSLGSGFREGGFVYIYTRPSDPSFVKIGFTADPVSQRLKTWSRDCGYQPTLVNNPVWTPHAKLIERLAQEELLHVRWEEQCEKCNKKHVEWFQTSIENANRVVERWRLWVKTKHPFGYESHRLTRKWSSLLDGYHTAIRRNELGLKDWELWTKGIPPRFRVIEKDKDYQTKTEMVHVKTITTRIRKSSPTRSRAGQRATHRTQSTPCKASAPEPVESKETPGAISPELSFSDNRGNNEAPNTNLFSPASVPNSPFDATQVEATKSVSGTKSRNVRNTSVECIRPALRTPQYSKMNHGTFDSTTSNKTTSPALSYRDDSGYFSPIPTSSPVQRPSMRPRMRSISQDSNDACTDEGSFTA